MKPLKYRLLFLAALLFANGYCFSQSDKKELRRNLKEAEENIKNHKYTDAGYSYNGANLYSVGYPYTNLRNKYFALGLRENTTKEVDQYDINSSFYDFIKPDTNNADGYLIQAAYYIQFYQNKAELLNKYYGVIAPDYEKATRLKNYDQQLYDTLTIRLYEITGVLKLTAPEDLTKRYKQIAANIPPPPPAPTPPPLTKKQLEAIEKNRVRYAEFNKKGDDFKQQKNYSKAADAYYTASLNAETDSLKNLALIKSNKCFAITLYRCEYNFSWYRDKLENYYKQLDDLINFQPDNADMYLLKSSILMYDPDNSLCYKCSHYVSYDDIMESRRLYKKAIELNNYDKPFFDSVTLEYNKVAVPRLLKEMEESVDYYIRNDNPERAEKYLDTIKNEFVDETLPTMTLKQKYRIIYDDDIAYKAELNRKDTNRIELLNKIIASKGDISLETDFFAGKKFVAAKKIKIGTGTYWFDEPVSHFFKKYHHDFELTPYIQFSKTYGDEFDYTVSIGVMMEYFHRDKTADEIKLFPANLVKKIRFYKYYYKQINAKQELKDLAAHPPYYDQAKDEYAYYGQNLNDLLNRPDAKNNRIRESIIFFAGKDGSSLISETNAVIDKFYNPDVKIKIQNTKLVLYVNDVEMIETL